MNLQTKISNEILSLYRFHDYEISKEQIIELTRLFIKIHPDIYEDDVIDFFENIRMGTYGTFYRAPTCLTTMFQQWKNLNVTRLQM